MSVPPSSQRRWFFGPVSDLALGCGLVYAGFFVAQTVAGPALRSALPETLLPLLILLFGAPHYGATLLRVYDQREDRRRYAVFAVWATAFLAIVYVGGVYSVTVASVLATLYLTWSPWHYSGQNYGVALLFLRRRGVPISRNAKRLVYGCFLLPYLMVFLALHGESGSAGFAPASYEGTELSFLSLGIPASWRTGLAALVQLAYGVCLVGAALVLSRGGRWRDLGPTALVTLTQALWFAIPVVGSHTGIDPLRTEFRGYALMWVAVGHFLQYLWITTYYAAASENRAIRLRYLGKTLLVGSAIWFLPTLLFAPGLLGRLPFDMGLGLLTASVVNLHHFILDGAIWKLRDGRIARALLRDPGDPDTAAPGGAAALGRPWLRQTIWAAGAFSLVISLSMFVDDGIAARARTQGDLESLRGVQERRRWMGRDSARTRLIVAREAIAAGDLTLAAAEIERSLALRATPDAHLLKGRIHREAGQPKRAMPAYRAALDQDPENVEALFRMGLLWRSLGEDARARVALERARALDPDNPSIEAAWRELQSEPSGSH